MKTLLEKENILPADSPRDDLQQKDLESSGKGYSFSSAQELDQLDNKEDFEIEVKSILGEKDLNKNTAIIKNSLNKPIKKLIDIPIENKVIEPESLKDVLKLNVNSINFGS